MKKSGIIIGIIAILVIAIIVVIIMVSKGPGTSPANTDTKPIESAKIGDVSNDIKSLSGKIVSIGNNVAVIEAMIALQDSSKPSITHNTSFTVDENTKITKTVLPTPEKMMTMTEPVTPKETTLIFSDLKIGDTLDIRSQANIYDNLKANTPFTASTINVIVYE